MPVHIQSYQVGPKRRRQTRIAALCVGLAGFFSAQLAFAFNFEDVADQARSLSQESYSAPSSNLPDSLKQLDFKHYSDIQFKPDASLWRSEDLPFDIGFFHQGMRYDTPVKINQVDEGQVEPLTYSPDQFNFGDSGVDPSSLQDVDGYAGFRVNHKLTGNSKQEMMVFLGASYFRAIGGNQRYGSSGRGVAINTALSSGEEFPRFKEFWIAKPKKDDPYLVIYALLDSRSMTGAYRFVVRPGADTVVDVRSELFLRNSVEKIGIAPLTSMYLFSPAQPTSQVNYRPAIHDADGLAIQTANDNGEDQWQWRQLANPQRLNISDIPVDRLRGFGLLQSSHNFANYQDLNDRYELRPSLWIKPLENWGKGNVELVEIPTPDETNDNIVAYWKPDADLPVGEPINFNYRMVATRNEQRLKNPDLAWVDQTRRSVGETTQDNLVRKADGSTAYIVDFKGPNLKDLDANSGVSVEASAGDNGNIVDRQVLRNPVSDGFRVILKVTAKDASKPVEMNAFIKDGTGRRLSETWSMVQQPHD